MLRCDVEMPHVERSQAAAVTHLRRYQVAIGSRGVPAVLMGVCFPLGWGWDGAGLGHWASCRRLQ